VFAGRYRPSTFLTLTLDSYGRVDSQGAAVDPDQYDYRRAARDAIHFTALLDRFWQNTRRCVGWDVQYFGTVEPQKRGAPHFHAAIRGAIPRTELRAITAATYHQVWWPAHDQLRYSVDRLPVWDIRAKAFTDPDTWAPLPSWEQACSNLTEPAHVVRFGAQVHTKGILGGTEEAGWHIGYLTNTCPKASDRPPASASTPPTPTASTLDGCTPNSASPPAHPPTVPRTVHTCGNGPPLQTPTSHPDPSCCCRPSPNDSDGKPNTPPPNSPPPALHRRQTVRQLMIRPPEGVRRMDEERMLRVDQVAELLGTGERFVRRLIEERRIAFTKVGRHVRIRRSVLLAFVEANTVQPVQRRRAA
jgi:excisionase family DNA binding protein